MKKDTGTDRIEDPVRRSAMGDKYPKLIIGVDLDGTAWDHEWPAIGAVRPNAAKVLQRLYDGGHTLIIWTARATPEHIQEAKDKLAEMGVRYHGFNDFPHSLRSLYGSYEGRKLSFSVLIDDISLLGIPHDWEDIYMALVQHWGIYDSRDLNWDKIEVNV